MSHGSDDVGDDCLLGHDPEDCPNASTDGPTINSSERDARVGLEIDSEPVVKRASADATTSEEPTTLGGHTRCPVCGDQISNSLLDG